MGDGRWRAVPLRTRLLALLALLMAMNVIDTAITVAADDSLRGLRSLDKRLGAAAQVQERLGGIRDSQFIELRGFIPTGDETFLRQYRRTVLRERRQLENLRRLLRDEPALLAAADDVAAEMGTWRRRAARPIIAAVRAGETSRATSQITAVGEPLIDGVRSDANRLNRSLDQRLAQVRGSIESTRDRLNRLLALTSGLALLLVVGSAWALRRWIAVPVASLSQQVDRVAAGQLREPVSGDGPPEFVKLGDDVEHMRRRIVSELEETQRAVEALEQNAPLVASLRSQLQATPQAALPAGIRIVGRLEPAHGVLAGDWYDVIPLDASRAVLIVVDVSGHGHEAGLRALWLKHLLSPAVQMGLEPGEALNWVAAEVGDTGDWFATCVIVEVDASTGRCLYANAGHPPPLLLTSAGIEQLPATGTLFGGLPRERWRTVETSLGVGETLVIYTDGITESRNDDGDMFGDEGLVSCLRSSPTREPLQIAEHVMSTVHAFGGERLDDDATLALITCSPQHDDPLSLRSRGPSAAREDRDE